MRALLSDVRFLQHEKTVFNKMKKENNFACKKFVNVISSIETLVNVLIKQIQGKKYRSNIQ